MSTGTHWPPPTGFDAHWWERFWADEDCDFGPPSPTLLSRARSHYVAHRSMSAVDVAAGDGRYALALAAIGYHTTAVELTTYGCRRIRAASGSGVDVERGDFLDLGRQTRAYDLVMCSGLLEEIEGHRHAAVVDGLTRWTAPGGLCMLRYCLEIVGRGRLVAPATIPVLFSDTDWVSVDACERSHLKATHANLMAMTGTVIAVRRTVDAGGSEA